MMQCAGRASAPCALSQRNSLSSSASMGFLQVQRSRTAPSRRVSVPRVTATVATETKEVALEAGRAAMRDWWLSKLAEKKSASPAMSLAHMEAARAHMRDWWLAQLAAKAAAAGANGAAAASGMSLAEMESARAEMREWWLAQLAGKGAAEGGAGGMSLGEMDAARAEMRDWGMAQLAGRQAEAEMDAQRAGMRDWWLAQLAAKAGCVDAGMDAGRAEMREWWMVQLDANAEQAEMEEGRAQMREWWLAQLVAKAGVKADAAQVQMDAARVEMRDWWMAQLEAKKEAQMDQARAEMREWAIARWQEAKARMEKPVQMDLVDMEAGRAGMREWWTQQLEAKAAAAEAEAEAVAEAEEAPAEAEEDGVSAPALDLVKEAEMEVAAMYVGDREREVIEAQLKKERARRQRKMAEREKDTLRALERGRREMRQWWEEKREATKRSYGLGGYEPVWALEWGPGGEGVGPVEIAGKGVVVGLAPVAEAAGVQTYTIVKKGVSFSHAYVYGKDKTMGFRKYRREYFIEDLSSTSGTFLNGKRLSTNVPYRLNPGDVVTFGTEVSLKVSKPSQ